MFAAAIMFATWIVLGIPAALVGIPWAMVIGEIGPVYFWALGIMRIGLRLARIRVETTWDSPPDPARHSIFLCNHVSNLDPPVVFPLLPGRASAFIKRSLMKIPVLGYGMRLANFIPVDRDGRVESAQESVRIAGQVLASGVHILSFVEGTRSRDGRLQPFKKGPFFLAMETGATVIPVSIYGTETMMKKGSMKIFPGTAHVRFHAPLEPRSYATREDLLDAVRASIASGLPEWMRA
ncbi:MAG TPA: lysophospholipid acyltransferase family protein [Acidobacteriaceae bacterium]|jgi:1-acyl-sn-glycerol-3-phosphate acyltransferase|nr:lysophospholipid acyltransferase family protein [Acidobacteriaceae bacterium]